MLAATARATAARAASTASAASAAASAASVPSFTAAVQPATWRSWMAAGVRSKSTYAIPNKEVAAKYMELSAGDRRAHVPLPSGAVQDPASFFKAIGRNTPTATDKFKDWNHLFVATSREMKKLGIKSQMRKYILGWREWYKRGNELKAIELPKRQKKHLKLQEEVRRARLERLGMI